MSCPATGGLPAVGAPARWRPRPGWWSRTSRPAGCGAVVRVEKAGGVRVVHLEDRRGRTKGFPIGPGLPARRRPGRAHPADRGRPRRPAGGQGGLLPYGERVARRRRGPRPRRLAGRGSSSRAATTPSWSRRSGATTCASRAWWSRCSTASTTWPGRSATSARAPRAGWACSSTTSCRAPRRAGWWTRPARSAATRPSSRSSATRTSTCGSPCAPSGWASGRGRSSPGARPGSTASSPSWAGRTGRQTDIAHAWKRILGTVRTYADLEPSLLASVEELIDFVTTVEG